MAKFVQSVSDVPPRPLIWQRAGRKEGGKFSDPRRITDKIKNTTVLHPINYEIGRKNGTVEAERFNFHLANKSDKKWAPEADPAARNSEQSADEWQDEDEN